MKVTNVRLRRIDNKNRLKAVATITLDDAFVVHDLRLIEGRNGLFVAMPSRRNNMGEYRDICHPITPDLRNHVEDIIIQKYQELGEELKAQQAITEDVAHAVEKDSALDDLRTDVEGETVEDVNTAE